jgi:hypothetical protein
MMAEELYRLPAGGRIRAAGLYPVWVLGMWGGAVLSGVGFLRSPTQFMSSSQCVI